MGAPKQKWTSEEEEALRAGVEKHGAGKWRFIQKDPEFSQCLAHRTNIDLKDKWRNLSGSSCPREKSRLPKLKGNDAIPMSGYPGAAVSPMVDDSVRNSKDGKVRCSEIIEAIAALREPNGSEVGAICGFIEQRHDVPPHFRRLLGQKLRRLVLQNKIEKVQNCYRLKDSTFATKTPTPKQKDPALRPSQNPGLCNKVSLEEASRAAAYKIADAEAKAFLASEAAKDAEKVLKMFEDTDSLRMLAEEVVERCSRGEIVYFTSSKHSR
ncbi:single myb histone 4-like [Iris pallida]|uniref:Single myb histone 4-like n=1 Tax=Iris pallida TaxID=29817 RepID=A0AAX6FCA7_IRIPA|nr:single myb histone 4-like [Iris pallida]KAJ6823004.1 single myb histone 4-like [Iris pallida]